MFSFKKVIHVAKRTASTPIHWPYSLLIGSYSRRQRTDLIFCTQPSWEKLQLRARKLQSFSAGDEEPFLLRERGRALAVFLPLPSKRSTEHETHGTFA
jgi:hypothetical protein